MGLLSEAKADAGKGSEMSNRVTDRAQPCITDICNIFKTRNQ